MLSLTLAGIEPSPLHKWNERSYLGCRVHSLDWTLIPSYLPTPAVGTFHVAAHASVTDRRPTAAARIGRGSEHAVSTGDGVFKRIVIHLVQLGWVFRGLEGPPANGAAHGLVHRLCDGAQSSDSMPRLGNLILVQPPVPAGEF